MYSGPNRVFLPGLKINGIYDLLKEEAADGIRVFDENAEGPSAQQISEYYKYVFTMSDNAELRNMEEEVIYNFQKFLRNVESR